MAADYDIITKNNRPNLGQQTVRMANDLLNLMQTCAALNNIAGHMWSGSDYTRLVAQFGLDATVDPANFLTLLGNLNTILNSNTDVTGANRLSQLQEFVNRLAGQ